MTRRGVEDRKRRRSRKITRCILNLEWVRRRSEGKYTSMSPIEMFAVKLIASCSDSKYIPYLVPFLSSNY
jgi:hypothetical protein